MFRALLLVALLAGSAGAEELVMPSAGKLLGVVISDEPGDWGVLSADLMPIEPKFRDGSKDAGWKVCLFEGPPGRYAVIKVPKGGGLKISTVILGAAGPVTPPPVVPPVVPPIIVTPPPVAGMRVLILDETAPQFASVQQRDKWLKQVTAMRDPAVRAYLDAKTIKGPEGPQWRKFDPSDINLLRNLPREWQELRAKLKPTEFPWVGIADSAGNVVFEGAYPASGAEALATFKQYGG
jgi:hypothetical protein